MKKVALHNLGCKVNAYETEAMQRLLEEAGYEIVPFAEGADIYIVNTCTVTNIADRKSRQMLHRAKKLNPKALVAAVGCYAQAAGKKLEMDDSIDLIIGNNKKKELVSILKAWEQGEEAERLVDISCEKEYERLSLEEAFAHTRAYVKVQDGCNQFCSYCIIPYTRGRVRSRPVEDVCAEVGRLAGNGCREVILTGIHLSSYGVDLEDGDLLSLIRAVHGVPGIDRIRLGSLEPGIITEAFAEALSRMEKVCPHFHLSLQSGCNATLKRMNRRYTAEEYEEKCRILRRFFEHPALTTDVIVGFPGETEGEFSETLEFLKRVAFFETHVFKYSRRQGTRAAAMEGQVDEAVKTRRSRMLLDLDRENTRNYVRSLRGRQVEILVEESVERGGVLYQVGHTREYIHAAVLSKEELTNQIVCATVDKLLEERLFLCKLSGNTLVFSEN